MPYIPKKDRPRLDPLIDKLAAELKNIGDEYNQNEQGNYPAAYAGLLNYAVSRLVGKFALLTYRYWTIALLTGVLENIKQEFYRRVASPYEDRQVIKNEDVPEYDELTKKLKE